MKITKHQIEQILAISDNMGLIKMGAPPDEYDSEARLIYKQLSATNNPTLPIVHQIVYQVFVDQFSYEAGEGKEDVAELFESYLPAADKIFKLIEA